MKRQIIAALVLLSLGTAVQGQQREVKKHRTKTYVVKTTNHEENIFAGLGGTPETLRFLCGSKSGGLKHCRAIEGGRR